MDINKVIELGEAIERTELGLFSQFSGAAIGWIIALLLVGILSVFLDVGLGGLFALLAAGVFAFHALFLPLQKEQSMYREEVKKWKDEIAYPFIQSLEKEQKEVIFIKIEPTLSHSVNGFMFMGSGSVLSKPVEKTPIAVSYKDNGITTRTDWVPTHMELTDQEKPYIEFQRLEKDLGHGIKAGIYNPQVYLPESYSFTDIK